MIDKNKQVRYTLEDCLHFQNKMKDLVKKKITENTPLTEKEKPLFFKYLPKALMSQGAVDPACAFIEGGWFKFASIQSLAHRMADLTTSKVFLKTTRPEKVEVTIPIRELWQFLYDKMLYLFPQATSEAIHISAESVERPQQKSFDFSSKGDLSG